MSDKVLYGAVFDDFYGSYRSVYVPIARGGPGDVVKAGGITVVGPDELPDGAVGWIAWETRRESVAPYEQAILEPEHEVFI